jgi:hypothetical protein
VADKGKCPKCKRHVGLTVDSGRTLLVTHGPGPNGEFICPGSGDKGIVRAARHLRIPGEGKHHD